MSRKESPEVSVIKAWMLKHPHLVNGKRSKDYTDVVVKALEKEGKIVKRKNVHNARIQLARLGRGGQSKLSIACRLQTRSHNAAKKLVRRATHGKHMEEALAGMQSIKLQPEESASMIMPGIDSIMSQLEAVRQLQAENLASTLCAAHNGLEAILATTTLRTVAAYDAARRHVAK